MSEGPSGVARIEAFSDGVFAIAITLLVFGLKAPAPEVAAAEGLWRALARLWPSFVAYALSFAIIGIMWANHHNIFRYIERANHAFVMWNLGLLFCVGFLPFPTAVLAEYLPSPPQRTAGAVFYGATLTVTAVFFNLLWRYAAGGRRLLRPGADPELVAAVTREYRLGPPIYAMATAAAYVSVAASLTIHAALAALYLIPNRSRP